VQVFEGGGPLYDEIARRGGRGEGRGGAPIYDGAAYGSVGHVLENFVIALVGKPGVGKFTVGSVLARLTGARLVDNHSINNVIFNAVAADGVTPLPPEVWAQVGRVRGAVLETIATIAPPDLSFIFTNFIKRVFKVILNIIKAHQYEAVQDGHYIFKVR